MIKTGISNQNETEDLNQALLQSLMTSDTFAPSGDRSRNLPLFLRQKDLAHILFMAEIYQQIFNVPGYIAEFGVMRGRNLNLIQCLRECYEPYNHTRRILGFDTFSGFVGAAAEDRGKGLSDEHLAAGMFSVPTGHQESLQALLESQEAISHLKHLRRFELVKGDVVDTLPRYLADNPHTILALCYLDLDLYGPTKAVLSSIRPHLVRGSILVFDELLNPDFPGETRAVDEIFGLSHISLRRSTLSGWKTYFVVE